MPIRALLFDADGVLQHPGPEFEPRLRAALGLPSQPLDGFLHAATEAELSTLTGEREFVEVLGPVLDAWAPGSSVAEVAAGWLEIEPDAKMLELVTRLRDAGYFCALATNQHRERGEQMIRALGYGAFFDRSFYSYELGQKKPDTSYFRAVLSALPFSPDEILFIDDHEDNLVGAAACGLATMHFVHDRTPEAVTVLASSLRQRSVRVPTADELTSTSRFDATR